MDKAFQAGWDCALGAAEKVLLSQAYGWMTYEVQRQFKDHLASLKCGAGKEPNPELVNALRAYMSQSGTGAEAAPEWFKQLHKCSAAQSPSKWLRDARNAWDERDRRRLAKQAGD